MDAEWRSPCGCLGLRKGLPSPSLPSSLNLPAIPAALLLLTTLHPSVHPVRPCICAPVGRHTEPVGHHTEPAWRHSEPAGRHTEPAGQRRLVNTSASGWCLAGPQLQGSGGSQCWDGADSMARFGSGSAVGASGPSPDPKTMSWEGTRATAGGWHVPKHPGTQAGTTRLPWSQASAESIVSSAGARPIG